MIWRHISAMMRAIWTRSALKQRLMVSISEPTYKMGYVSFTIRLKGWRKTPLSRLITSHQIIRTKRIFIKRIADKVLRKNFNINLIF